MTRKTLAAILVSLSLGLAAWAGMTLVSHESRVSGAEREVHGIAGWLQRIDGRLENIEQHLRHR